MRRLWTWPIRRTTLANLTAISLMTVGAVMLMVPGPGLKPLALAALARSADDPAEPPPARQVTSFAILATPGSKEMDSRLLTVRNQLRKVLPDHGFKLVDVNSKRIDVGESISCDLGHGNKAETILEQSQGEDGKVWLRCHLTHEGEKVFSTLVKSPQNQLFFYERTLDDGTRVLVGVGAR